jgi:hypothetical protein
MKAEVDHNLITPDETTPVFTARNGGAEVCGTSAPKNDRGRVFVALTGCTASAIHEHMPTTLKLAAFRLEKDILDGMEALRTRDGIPASEQVRRALRAYLTSKGVRLVVRRPRQNARK